MNNSNKPMGFAHDLVKLIQNGSKTLTYRLGDSYSFLKINDRVDVLDSSDGKKFGTVEIVSKTMCLFKNLPLNREGHEPYKTKDEMRKIFQKYYNRDINDSNEFLIIEFKLVRPNL